MGQHRSSDNPDPTGSNNNIDESALDMPAGNNDGREQSVVEGIMEWGQAVEYCPNVSRVHAGGMTFIDGFDQDSHTHQRIEVPWYPFASQKDWEVAYWLMRTNLSMSEIDEYLSLNLVSFLSGFLDFLLYSHTMSDKG
jgi:hypothetical protein